MTTLSIHGHFYQPDRRDPRTGLVPADPTAEPVHDWNERIYQECYAPNARAGNFARIGFDIGPTLLVWLRAEHPGLHAALALQAAGRSAMAQGWHHAILPLARPRDRKTEIRWGIADFAFRFGHAPTGFWLPETAVDEATLCDLADEGIRYVILAPWQAAGAIDERRPYRVDLPGGRSIIAAFYDGDLSARVSFEARATENADRFITEYVLPRARPLEDGSEPLLLIATDGELYGHHQAFRDHFLRALPAAAAAADVSLRSLGEIVADLDVASLPAVRIAENTSWSCHHGVARWSSGCPCSPDGRWKPLLRAALDALSELLDAASEAAAVELGLDLWTLRDRYVAVAAGYAEADDFARAALAGSPHNDDPAAIALVRGLLDAQRARLAAYTSCAWFWEDPSRQETITALRYAAHAMTLVREISGTDAEPGFRLALAPIRSSVTGETGLELLDRAMAPLDEPSVADAA